MELYRRFKVRYLVLSIFCSLILVNTGFPQAVIADKQSIAVIPFTVTRKAIAGGELADLISAELVNTGTFTVVDKSNSIDVESEFPTRPKDSIDPATAVEIGKKTGARFLLFGNVTEYGEKARTSFTGVTTYEGLVKFNLRAMDSMTGEVIFSQTFEKRGVSLGEAKTGSVVGSFGSKAMQDAVGKSLKEAVAVIVKRLGSPPARTD